MDEEHHIDEEDSASNSPKLLNKTFFWVVIVVLILITAGYFHFNKTEEEPPHPITGKWALITMDYSAIHLGGWDNSTKYCSNVTYDFKRDGGLVVEGDFLYNIIRDQGEWFVSDNDKLFIMGMGTWEMGYSISGDSLTMIYKSDDVNRFTSDRTLTYHLERM